MLIELPDCLEQALDAMTADIKASYAAKREVQKQADRASRQANVDAFLAECRRGMDQINGGRK